MSLLSHLITIERRQLFDGPLRPETVLVSDRDPGHRCGLVIFGLNAIEHHSAEHEFATETGVGAVVVAEVVVTGVFTSKGCARLGHGAFDEGVSNSGAHCGAATLGNYLGNRLGADQVVQNRGTRRSTDAATMAVVIEPATG
ncbi:hypothetical protein GQR58_029159 [Nymphon striatum]|nr:hypothetical protein GQR58_029159 [Nymphon striatum]